MDLRYLDKKEYRQIPIIRIASNQNGLPFLISKLENQSNTHSHRHEFVQIIYIRHGKLKHVLNDKVFDVFQGDILIIPPYVPHHFIDKDSDYYEIIEFEFVPEFIDGRFSTDNSDMSFIGFAYLEPFLVVEKEIKPRLNLSSSIKIEVENIFSEILSEYETRKSDYKLLIRALLEKLLVLVGREFNRSIEGTESRGVFNRHKDAINQSISYIEENLSGTVTIEEAARVAILSPSYYRYLFKMMLQKNFVEYVNSRRISAALELLQKKPEMLIIDVCFKTGFNSVTHFNRVFRQITGTTPTAYRKSSVSPRMKSLQL